MFRRLRSLAATLAVFGMIAGLAGPASAAREIDTIDPNGVPKVFDLVVMRPIGLAATAAGAAVFVPAGLVATLFDREGAKKMFNTFVRGPFDFTFRDPLGSHGSDRSY